MEEKKLGAKAQDLITGYKGFITAKVEYYGGQIKYQITPVADEDNKIVDGEWFENARVLIGDWQ